MTAPECAGVIHTDFQKGFIKAEVIPFSEFVEYGNTAAVKEAGKLQIERRSWELLILMGSVPTAFFYAFGGDAVLHLKLSRIIIAAVVIGASAGLIWLIHRDRKITTQ